MKILRARMEVHEPTAEEMIAFRRTAVPFMRAYMEERYGAELVTEFLAAAQTAERMVQQGEGTDASKSKYDFETLWSLVSDEPPEKISEDR
jgi:hypothetical protein